MGKKPNDNTHDLFAVRLQKLQDMRENGFDPFRANCEQEQTSSQAKALYTQDKEKSPIVKVAGRILFFRLMGKAAFVKIQDGDGLIQLYFQRDEIGNEAYQSFKKLDIGDIIGAQGPLFKTKTGEITVRVKTYLLVSKAVRPLPEKWKGLTDNEQIYRQRYLDLIANQDSRQRFILRSKIISRIRRFLDERGFIEVETPVLQTKPGGAAARPFKTFFNSLNCEYFLRIALELHLKQLLVGGLDRVYEIGRVFRNEGLSRKHNPEFTMLELYQAYSDYQAMMTLIYELIQTLCQDVLKTTTVQQSNGTVIELGGQWPQVTYKQLIIKATEDVDWFSRSKEKKLAKCNQLGINIDTDIEDFEITQQVFEKQIEPTLIQPTFITHLPKELCPLAKINQEDSTVLDVFELCINGQEIAPAYSEQNDPFIQKAMFEAQAGKEIQKVDHDFLTALEHGMPPAGGMGVGIDRLCMLLTGASNIRNTILFPSLKPV
jgi:lysyl-tRNA synthetase, class II